MQSINGGSRQIVVSHGLKQPRGLALDPDNGYMYFADWHESTSRIERAWLDGSHRRVLVGITLLYGNLFIATRGLYQLTALAASCGYVMNDFEIHTVRCSGI